MIEGRPVWAVQDTRCGHDFTASVAREVLDTVLEVGGPLFPGAFLVHPVAAPDDWNARARSEPCETCAERSAAMLVAVMRPGIADWAETKGADPAAAIRLYDDLVDAGHGAHAAMHATQKTVATGLLAALEWSVPDADDPRWTA